MNCSFWHLQKDIIQNAQYIHLKTQYFSQQTSCCQIFTGKNFVDRKQQYGYAYHEKK